MLQASYTYIEMPIVVHEFMPSTVDDIKPSMFNKRAKIWHAAIPPDQLNPVGFLDGDLAAFMPTQVGAAAALRTPSPTPPPPPTPQYINGGLVACAVPELYF